LTQAVEQLLGKAVSQVLKKDFYRTAAIKQKIDIHSLPLHPIKGND